LWIAGNCRLRKNSEKVSDCQIARAVGNEVSEAYIGLNEQMVILFFKPYGVLSQFSEGGRWETLAQYGPFPPGVYAAGRLDADSEGLLVLTDENAIKTRLADPRFAHDRTYLVQVERSPSAEALHRLRSGVLLDGQKTRPAKVRLLLRAPELSPRRVPIRFRKNVATAWVELTITEGRNRQVRRMTAAVGHPTLRLLRMRVGTLTLKGLLPAETRVLTQDEVKQLKLSLGISRPEW
jgi:23S rRNA pseudouridine2457 synthase